MKKTKEVRLGLSALLGAMTLVLMLVLGLSLECFSIVSHAESKAKVTANSANIRKEPNASSAVLGSTEKDKEISIKSQTTGSDGAVWYQVYVNADTLGYIRSDLVSITDGTTPPTENTSSAGTGNNNTQTPPPAETPVEVTAVQPISASATGGQSIRVRANASTTSQIVTTAKEGLALTVTGQATGTDGNVWYQVTFIDNGSEVTGFIRNDYVTLSGELVPVTQEQPPAEGGEEAPSAETPEVKKDWETQLQGDEWYLIDNVEGKQYSVQQIFDVGTQNAQLYEESRKTVKTQKIVIIILVLFVILLAAGVTFLFLKIKDMVDSEYFSRVEDETIRRRNNRPQAGGGQKVMHTAGTDMGGKSAAQRPGTAGQRLAGAQSQSVRPADQRPSGTQSQNVRPVGQGQRPAGTQSQNVRPAGQRPAGTQSQNARPVGQRPAGTQSQNARPVGQRPAGTQGQNVRPVGQRPAAPAGKHTAGAQRPNPQNQGFKSRNFMSDDDEFEFEFLNWDGDEE